ncbi:hypothetical protein JCM11491_001868 [Sporobolomyces phaffii]
MPTHRVLSLYYPHLCTLGSVFPKNVVKPKDAARFEQFLEQTLVGSLDRALAFNVPDAEDTSIGMSEIYHQVLDRIFKAHSTEYYKARKAGTPAFTIPKNVLACGHRLVTMGNDNRGAGGRVNFGTGAAYESVFTNTIASTLTSSRDWSTLLSRVGPDAIIKMLASPAVALFRPLQNGCYVQISGTPLVELKVRKEARSSGGVGTRSGETKCSKKKTKGRKTHVHAVKKRGKKKKKVVEGNTAPDASEQEDTATELGEEEQEAMQLDPPLDEPPSASPVLPPVIVVDSPRSARTRLGPSKSAPALLVTSQLQSRPRTDAQEPASQFPLPSNSATLAASQQTQPPISSNTQSKLERPSTSRKPGTKRGKRKQITHPHNTIVFSRHRLYHARLSKKDGKIAYGLSPKHILSRLGLMFDLPTSALLPRRGARSVDPQTTSKLYTPARHLSKYVFPKQFRLNNVFKGDKVNPWIRVRPDHENREVEIGKLGKVKTPARLKRQVVPLLNRMIVLHHRCNYRKLLGIKCPSKVIHRHLDDAEKKSLVSDLLSEPPATQLSRTNISKTVAADKTSIAPSSSHLAAPTSSHASSNRIPDSQPNDTRADSTNVDEADDDGEFVEVEDDVTPFRPRTGFDKKPKLAEYACTPYEVESYVQAVVGDVIPRAFWGSDRNAKLISKQISQFLRMRRFETISLHSLLQGYSTLDCEWLEPSAPVTFENLKNTMDLPGKKKTRVDVVTPPIEMEKRKELLAEFLYWFFDSFVTEVVRTAFYVTDSATHQNRPLYFRQDDWKALTAPLLESLGQTVFERVPDNQVIALERQPRELSFSYVRLLPKEAGVRPIVNLARRPLRIGPNGEKEVGQPINQILRGVFDVLTFESRRKPHLVGSLVTNPQEIYAKLKQYKASLFAGNEDGIGELPELYFVKVDVKSCFDTIKQDKLLALVEEILSETLYYIQKYSQVVAYSGKTARMFKRQACADDDLGSFQELAMKLAENLHDVVLTDQVRYDDVDRDKFMALLKEHITTNLVKVNGHLYRQRDGIPQGSVLSSLLCSLFYGDMENTRLAFTKDIKSLLMRYVDDFMFVTTKKHLAVRFLQTMVDGIPEYGCFVSTEKRLTNFDVSLDDGEVVPPLASGEDFSYCGLAIDTKTLEIKMNLRLQMNKEIVNQLTIQRFRKPGEAFLNAMLRAVKVRAQSMYTDTNFNSKMTVLSNIYEAMLVVALKYRAYVQEWCGSLKGKVVFFWNALRKIVKYEHSTLVRQGRSRKAVKLSAAFELEQIHVTWLSYHAFYRVLSRSPATFSPLLRMLLAEIKTPRVRRHLPVLKKIVYDDKNGFVDKGLAKGR